MVAAAHTRHDGTMSEDSGSQPEPTDIPAATPASDGPGRLIRSHDGRLLAGVCAGLGRYTRIDPVVFRVGFALLVITTGIGVLLYLIAFLLMGAPDGGPSKVERMWKRVLDGDTVLALLGAALGTGVLLGAIGKWGSGDALAVVVVFGLALLVARSRGVDLVQVARSLPERVKGRPLSSWTPPASAAYSPADGMVDLARLGRRTDSYATGPYGIGAQTSGPRAGGRQAAAADLAPPFPPHPQPYTQPQTPAYTRPEPSGPRRASYLTALTLMVAVVVGAVLYALAGHRPHFAGVQIVIAGALAVVACGLFLGAWFGRDRKLVLVGAIMSLALASTSIAGNSAVARRTYHTLWRPAATAQAERSHRVVVGQGVVDLTTVPLEPGRRLQVNAEVILGTLAVRVPTTARVEIDGHAYLGDITVDRQVTSGPGARVRRVLEPVGRSAGTAATIVLHLRSKVGDMEVTRVPA